MATQAPSGKGKKGGKKGKKGDSPKKGKGKKDKGPKDESPPSLLKQHLKNKPKEDTASSRDSDVAKFQNEAAVLEKTIRNCNSKIERDKVARQEQRTKRQAAYDKMDVARKEFQKYKAEKEIIWQQIAVYRGQKKQLRGGVRGKGKNQRARIQSMAQLKRAIKDLEDEMQTEVLSLREEKNKIREIKELRKMRPEVEKLEAKNAQFTQFTESTKEQHEANETELARLKKIVNKAYEKQQELYKAFQAEIEADDELNNAIKAAIDERKESYERQKTIRTLVSARKRDYTSSQRDNNRWQQQTRRLERDVDFWTRKQQREERERQQRETRKAWEASRSAEKTAKEAPTESDGKGPAPPSKFQEPKRRPERDDKDAQPSAEKDGPRPPRTTPKPKPVQRRERPVRQRPQRQKPRDASEEQKTQLKNVIRYVKTLLPKTEQEKADDQLNRRQTGNFKKKGGFKPSRDNDLFQDDLFAFGGRKKTGRKVKKKKKKNKVQNVFFVESHVPGDVMDDFKRLRRWLKNNSYPNEIKLPMTPGESEQCIKDLAEAEKFVENPNRGSESKPQPATETPEPATETPEPAAPEMNGHAEDEEPTAQDEEEAQPDEEEPTEQDAQADEPTEDAAGEPASEPVVAESEQQTEAPPPDGSGQDQTDSGDPDDAPAADIEEPAPKVAEEPADAVPETSADVDKKPTPTPVEDDVAPKDATIEDDHPDDDTRNTSDDDDDESESSDGVEVTESMII